MAENSVDVGVTWERWSWWGGGQRWRMLWPEELSSPEASSCVRGRAGICKRSFLMWGHRDTATAPEATAHAEGL